MDEQQLLAALQGNEPRAAGELVQRYGDRLLRSAFSLCGNQTEAEDLVQETFLQAIRSVDRFQNRSSLYTWLHAILINLTRRYHRQRQRLIYDDAAAEREVDSAEEDPSASDAGAASSALLTALRRISQPHREALVLRYYENMKIGQIALRLGISQGTVKSRLHYAIGEMQKLLPDELNLFGSPDTKRV